MSFVTQEDVFATLEPVMAGVFQEFAGERVVDAPPFVRIPYDEALRCMAATSRICATRCGSRT